MLPFALAFGGLPEPLPVSGTKETKALPPCSRDLDPYGDNRLLAL